MSPLDTILRPEALALTALAAVFAGLLLKDDTEKWHWRAYLWTAIFVNFLFGVFGPWAYLFGVIAVIFALFVYFSNFQNRRFTLRDMMLYVLLLASMCTQIASAVWR